MSLCKTVLLSTVAAAALSFSIFGAMPVSIAQESFANLGENEAVAVGRGGKITKGAKKMNDDHHKAASSMGARELPQGAVIFRKNNKVYVIENRASSGTRRTTAGDGFGDMFMVDSF